MCSFIVTVKLIFVFLQIPIILICIFLFLKEKNLRKLKMHLYRKEFRKQVQNKQDQNKLVLHVEFLKNLPRTLQNSNVSQCYHLFFIIHASTSVSQQFLRSVEYIFSRIFLTVLRSVECIFSRILLSHTHKSQILFLHLVISFVNKIRV